MYDLAGTPKTAPFGFGQCTRLAVAYLWPPSLLIAAAAANKQSSLARIYQELEEAFSSDLLSSDTTGMSVAASVAESPTTNNNTK